jgi:hypothetical protein
MGSDRRQTTDGTGGRHGEAPKRLYSAPEVRVLGSVGELTLANGSLINQDNVSGTFKGTP